MIEILQPEVIKHLITSAIILAAASAIGLVFDRVILAALRRAAARTSWEGDDILIHSLKGVSVFWFFLAGAYIAVHILPIPPDYLPLAKKALVVILLISATVVAARIASGLVNLSVRKNEAATKSVSILVNVTRLAVAAVGILIILQFVGISITPILTALGVGGLAVALALQGILSNLFSGMQIIASRKVRVGDYIRLEGGEEGNVMDINWHNTTIRALANNVIVVPNSKLANAVVTDYHQPEKELSVLIQVGVAYRSDLDMVERVTIDVARDVMRNVTGGVESFEPFIRYHTFGESAIQFSIILRAQEFTDQYLLKHEMVKRLHKRFRTEGIEIPFPVRTIEMRKGADAAFKK